MSAPLALDFLLGEGRVQSCQRTFTRRICNIITTVGSTSSFFFIFIFLTSIKKYV